MWHGLWHVNVSNFGVVQTLIYIQGQPLGILKRRIRRSDGRSSNLGNSHVRIAENITRTQEDRPMINMACFETPFVTISINTLDLVSNVYVFSCPFNFTKTI